MRIAVFGLGYVGCVTGACLARLGHQVYGVDVSETKVRMINDGRAPLREHAVERLVEEMVGCGRFRATQNPAEAMRNAEISLICVGTPSQKDGTPNLQYLQRAMDEICAALDHQKRPHTIAVRSTVPPGTMEQIVIPALAQCSRGKNGGRFHFCFHPEFLREGSSIEDFFNPPYTVIGAPHPDDARQMVRLWRPIKAPLYVTSLKVAEMLKYADNAFHALKVSFANEIGSLSQALAIDGREVMRIFSQNRKLNLSPLYLRPGFAFGGPCLPKDLRALSKMGKEHRVEIPVIQNVLKSNLCHLDRARDLILAAGDKQLGVLGLVFKSDTDDLRESPICQLVKKLIQAKRRVKIFDPQVNLARLVGANRDYVEKELPELPGLLAKSVDEVLAASVIIVAGTHPEFAAAVEKTKKNQLVIDLTGRLEAAKSRIIKGLCW